MKRAGSVTLAFFLGAGAAHAQSPAAANEFYVSFTTLAAPKEARKAYERASREAGKKTPNLVKISQELERALSLYPQFAAAWYFLGGTLLERDDIDGARRAFERAVAADPRFPNPYVSLAAIELKSRHFAEAARLADSALRLDPRLTEAHYYSVLANMALHNPNRAKQSIDVILETGEDRRYPEVHALLAEIHVAAGDRAAAAAEYRRLLELDPGSTSSSLARQRLAEWKAQEKL
jgi:Tfp pilus assembly protein PilF